MATIRTRAGARGTRYQVIIRRSLNRTQRYREVQTFDTRADAEQWAKDREDALNDPAAPDRAPPASGPTLAVLIRWYINSFSTVTPWGRTKQTSLEYLERHPIGKIGATGLNPAMLVEHIRARRAHGASGPTAGNDLTWIGCVLRAAKDCGRCSNIDPAAVDEARLVCNKLQLICRPRRREVRPTPEQLDQLTEYFNRRDQRSEIPMIDIMWFAIDSARREAEICQLRWSDNDTIHHTGLVRDAKHPFRKAGNNRRFKYTPEAWEIADRQPRTSDFIFPYKPQSVSAAFTRACKVLGIEDLTFHDLRHEAASRLFERGYTIPQVAHFTLHESWEELKRYTHLLRRQLRDLPDRARITAPILDEAIPHRIQSEHPESFTNSSVESDHGYHSQEGASGR